MKSYQIKRAAIEDWNQIKAVYIEGIQTGNATFETACGIPSSEKWFAGKIKGSIFKITDNKQHIVGWSALSGISDRCVYGGVAEVSVYVSGRVQGKGIGTRLLSALIDFAENSNIWTLQAGIFPENKASIKLHKKLGFRKIGIREKLGKMEDRWRDVVLLERRSKTIF